MEKPRHQRDTAEERGCSDIYKLKFCALILDGFYPARGGGRRERRREEGEEGRHLHDA